MQAVQLSSRKRDDAAGTHRRRFLLVRVLDRVRAVLDRRDHRAERDTESLEQAGNLWLLGHQKATFRIAVMAVLSNATGMRNFQAKVWS